MLKNRLQKLILETWQNIEDVSDINFQISIPPKEFNADFATNICLVRAKALKKSPKILAEEFIKILDKGDFIDETEIAGAGFVNFRLKRQVFIDELKEIFGNDKYGYSKEKDPKKILIEYVSSNPTGPLHIGHGRGAVIGDALSRILAAVGHDVTREYYVNDAGNQVEVLAKTLEVRFRQVKGEECELPDNSYKGEYMIDIARELSETLDKNIDISTIDFKKIAVEKILDIMKQDLVNFRVEFDNWFSECSLFAKENGKSKVDFAIERLKAKDALLNEEGALWMKTKDVNSDDKNRVIVRSDGTPTYFASDIAYHDDKFRRGFDFLINIWGADHHGYVPRLKMAVEYLGYDPKDLYIILYQLVALMRDGVKIAMSTRAGQFVTLQEVLDEVGVDATRYFLLMRSGDNTIDFDLELAKKHSSENPVYYIQYAHARICSILQNLGFDMDNLDEIKANLEGILTQKEEFELIKHLTHFPETIQVCAREYSPHYMTTYLLELAGLFHTFYNKHKVSNPDNKDLTLSRAFLCKSVANVLKTGLKLLGISAPTSM